MTKWKRRVILLSSASGRVLAHFSPAYAQQPHPSSTALRRFLDGLGSKLFLRSPAHHGRKRWTTMRTSINARALASSAVPAPCPTLAACGGQLSSLRHRQPDRSQGPSVPEINSGEHPRVHLIVDVKILSKRKSMRKFLKGVLNFMSGATIFAGPPAIVWGVKADPDDPDTSTGRSLAEGRAGRVSTI